MREKPTWRIPAGVLALVVALAAYTIAIAIWLAPYIAEWHALAQLPVYIALGVAWLWMVPIRRFLKWMETGRWN